MSMTMTRRLRELLARPKVLMAPGAADALTARLIARHGFEAIYMTGAGTSAVRLGMPDVGLLTMNEMVDNARAHRRCLAACRSSPTPTPATAGRSTCSARCAPTSAPASPASTSRTSSGPSAAAISPASR